MKMLYSIGARGQPCGIPLSILNSLVYPCSVWILLPVMMEANDTPPRPVHIDDVTNGAITQACHLDAPEHGRLDRTRRVGPAASIGEAVELAPGGDGATSF